MNIDINPLVNISRKGSINFHYASGIIKTSKSGFVTTGYNDNTPTFRDYMCRKIQCTAKHAEQAAVTNLLKKLATKSRDGKKKLNSKDMRRKVKKYKIVTIRSRKHNEHDGSIKYNDCLVIDGYDIIDAAPCQECVKFLLNHGFTSVYFIDNTNKINKMKLNEETIKDYKLSDAQKKYKINKYNK